MLKLARLNTTSLILLVSIIISGSIGLFILRSIALTFFWAHLSYIVIAILLFIFFIKIDFEIYEVFAPHLYFISILFLVLTLVIGQVTRGSVRWIEIGELTFQPSEIVRPFLLLYTAKYAVTQNLSIKRLIILFALFALPTFLILVQPSLGVAVLTSLGFFGVLLSANISKKYIFIGVSVIFLSLPLIWLLLAPYQKERINTFFDPSLDPLGAGYNSIQSMIAVGSGKIFGRGLGEGVQTQLAFLPEKHTDFIFAAITEELGFFGAIVLLITLFVIYLCLVKIIENAKNPTSRAYITSVTLILFTQTFVHIGMNMGLLPITGVPLPFVSAGGSALLGTTISVAIALKAGKTIS